MSNVSLEANLTKDPTLAYTSDNTPVCNISVAENRRFQKPDGSWDSQVSYYDCVVWRQQGVHVYESLHKGDMVVLTGRVEIKHLSENSFGSLAPARAYMAIKHLGDFGVALLMLPVALPVMAACARMWPTIAFVNRVAAIANEEDHHPDLSVHYDNCAVTYSTHSAGGVTLNDLICAARTDAVAA